MTCNIHILIFIMLAVTSANASAETPEFVYRESSFTTAHDCAVKQAVHATRTAQDEIVLRPDAPSLKTTGSEIAVAGSHLRPYSDKSETAYFDCGDGRRYWVYNVFSDKASNAVAQIGVAGADKKTLGEPENLVAKGEPTAKGVTGTEAGQNADEAARSAPTHHHGHGNREPDADTAEGKLAKADGSSGAGRVRGGGGSGGGESGSSESSGSPKTADSSASSATATAKGSSSSSSGDNSWSNSDYSSPSRSAAPKKVTFAGEVDDKCVPLDTIISPASKKKMSAKKRAALEICRPSIKVSKRGPVKKATPPAPAGKKPLKSKVS